MSAVLKRSMMLCWILLWILPSVFSDERSSIAVLPLQHEDDISYEASRALTEYLKAGLKRTDLYHLVEQEERVIQQLLDAQKYSLSGISSDNAKIEIGALTSAEQLVIGSLSYLSDLYIISAKIIDVSSGRILRVETMEQRSIDDILQSMDTFAFRLSGLVTGPQNGMKAARRFSSLFIETEPTQAEIFINGVKRTTSPDVIQKVPVGEIEIEAIKGNLYVKKRIQVEPESQDILLTLKEQYGDLFIKTDVPDLAVYLDGERLGSVDAGVFEDIPSGYYILTLISEAKYWSNEVFIEADTINRIIATPIDIGRITIEIPSELKREFRLLRLSPQEFTCSVKGNGISYSLTQYGTYRYIPGEYRVRCEGGIYEPFETTILVKKGENHRIPGELFQLSKSTRKQLYGDAILSLGDTLLGMSSRSKALENSDYTEGIEDLSKLWTRSTELLDGDDLKLIKTHVDSAKDKLVLDAQMVRLQYEGKLSQARKTRVIDWAVTGGFWASFLGLTMLSAANFENTALSNTLLILGMGSAVGGIFHPISTAQSNDIGQYLSRIRTIDEHISMLRRIVVE